MKIRLAKKTDLKPILLLFKELDAEHVENSKDIKSAIPNERYKMIFKKVFEKNSPLILTVAKNDDQVLGFALGKIRTVTNRLIFVDQIIGEILYLVIKIGYKRKGVGRKLIEDLEFRLKESGVDKFELKVFGFNTETMKMPEKINYKVKYTIYEKYF